MLPTFASVRNSANPDGGNGEKVIDNLRKAGGILGIEEQRKK